MIIPNLTKPLTPLHQQLLQTPININRLNYNSTKIHICQKNHHTHNTRHNYSTTPPSPNTNNHTPQTNINPLKQQHVTQLHSLPHFIHFSQTNNTNTNIILKHCARLHPTQLLQYNTIYSNQY